MIIALSGKKQSGKNTCGEVISEHFRNNYPQLDIRFYSFADALKRDICINILGLSVEQCYGSDEQKNTMTDIIWDGKTITAREVMQRVGTDIFRTMKDDVWTEATLRKIKSENPDIAIITDCRFPNEVKAVQDNNGIVIRLTRGDTKSTHPSETALDECNYDWNNFTFVLDNKDIDVKTQTVQLIEIVNNKSCLKFMSGIV